MSAAAKVRFAALCLVWSAVETLLAADVPAVPATSKLLPDRTIGLFVAENVSRTAEDLKKTSLYKLWKEPEVKTFLEPVVRKLSEMLKVFEEKGEFRFEDVVSMFKGQVAFALVGVAMPEEGKGFEPQPELAMLAELSDRAAASRILARLTSAMKEAGGPEIQTWELGPLAFGRVAFDPQRKLELGYVLTTGALYVAMGPEGKLLQEITSAALGQPRWKTLAEDADFQKAVLRAGARRDCLGYLSVKRFLDTIMEGVRREGGRKAADLFRQVSEVLGLNSVRYVSFSEVVDGPGFRSEFFVNVPAPRKGLFGILPDRPVRNELLRLAPSDSRGLLCWHFRPEAVLRLARELVEITAPEQAASVDEALKLVKQSTRIDIERDILGGLGLEGAFFSVRGDSAGMGLLGQLANLVLVMRPVDPSKFKVAYDALVELATAIATVRGMQLQERLSDSGVPIKYLKAPMGLSPAMALTKSYLIISPSVEVVADVIKLLERGQDSPLTGSADYEKALARAGVAPGFLLAYNRPTRPEDIAQMLAMLPMATPLLQRAASDPETPSQLRELLWAINLANFPSAEALTRHGVPGILVGWDTEDGVGVTSWGALGISGGSVVAGGVAMAFALPAIETARERARRMKCMSNLKQVGVGLHLYSADHGEKFPPKLQDLVPKYVSDETILVCPSGKRGYAYISGLTAKDPPNTILAFEMPGNHQTGGNVLFLDGHVEWRGNVQVVLRQAESLIRRLNAQGRKLELIQPAPVPQQAPAGIEELF